MILLIKFQMNTGVYILQNTMAGEGGMEPGKKKEKGERKKKKRKRGRVIFC